MSGAMHTPCTMGVGCDEYGICYAEAHGQPKQCPHYAPSQGDGEREAKRILFEALERIATVDMGGGFLGAQACRTVARAAIAKARGGQS